MVEPPKQNILVVFGGFCTEKDDSLKYLSLGFETWAMPSLTWNRGMVPENPTYGSSALGGANKPISRKATSTSAKNATHTSSPNPTSRAMLDGLRAFFNPPDGPPALGWDGLAAFLFPPVLFLRLFAAMMKHYRGHIPVPTAVVECLRTGPHALETPGDCTGLTLLRRH